uniref:Epoxyqueuosine reductase n=1 Tax=Candidatus Kentrum eta TaxID=2126337 RepID=A0A450VAQ6_9GAMM|nr:MAG: epoxyqueuosine reductase [Candidatus Kentron sp. H]VFK01865.1 MAG: epoxyqueuosine reductase [Candidatus Kentron sp. H]VFK05217.1 MAG: epoxyqueuosine reductase [Candidatus Kentron sp. H]
MDYRRLSEDIERWGRELGFGGMGVSAPDLSGDEERLRAWLAAGRHGGMGYMARHGLKRTRPAELVPGTRRVISARLDYLPEDGAPGAWRVLRDPRLGYIARYALGRDYHKVLRRRLARLAERIAAAVGGHGDVAAPGPGHAAGGRVFTDSAPVLEKALARNAGLGWMGKHTNLIARDAGSWFVLGEIYTPLPLPVAEPARAHCGSCRACMTACPTGAIRVPWELDARRCVSYLTMEYRGSIPLGLRPRMGNRIFGCDDCQLVCPWNRFARVTEEKDFLPRHGLAAPDLVSLFGWSEAEFLARTAGSALRRVGYEGWLRNIAVALGNASPSSRMRVALEARAEYSSPLVAEHVAWALARQGRGPCRAC